MNQEIEKNKAKDWYISNFQLMERGLNGGASSALHKFRKEAIEKFETLEFPTSKTEEWRFTNIVPLLKYNFKPSMLIDKTKLSKEEIAKFLIPGLDAYTAVFIDGFFSKEFSNLPSMKGIKTASLKEIEPEYITKNLGKVAQVDTIFDALNASLLSDGLYVEIADNIILDKPFYMLFISGAKENYILSQTRNVIIAGNNSQAKFIEGFYSLNDNKNFTNSVTELHLKDNAIVDYYRVQQESDEVYHISKVRSDQLNGSVLNLKTFTFGNALVRNEVYTGLNGQGAEAHLYGAYIADKERLVDNFTVVDHLKPHCTSNQLYKGILDGKSRVVFSGRIRVEKDAQKTNAYQSNKNLALSSEALVDSKPQLEIFADDVKCTHGATIGQLEDESMFYLQSRGISEATARMILIQAFTAEILDSVEIESLREYLNLAMTNKLKK
jgi:Fe-S cluster assembly protein SufD